MKKFLIKFYTSLGVKDPEKWNTLQLWFGQYYLGFPILVTMIFILISMFI